MIAMAPETVTLYWLEDVGPERWFDGDEALNEDMRRRFADLWEMARQGGLEHWRCSAPRALAYILLTDQFPRNMFAGDAKAFATDKLARSAAKEAIDKGWDLATPEPERHFFYMPLVHSECADDQDRAVRLILTRMPRDDGRKLLHARAHREVIRRFGRFPFRNAALKRTPSNPERTFMEEGGYGAVVRALGA